MKFAANLSFLFTELNFRDRFRAASEAGFTGVEYLFPYQWPADDIADWLAEAGLVQVLFNVSPGDWDAGERGLAAIPGREAEFFDGLGTALDYADTLGCRRLHAMAGLVDAAHSRTQCHDVFLRNLAEAVPLCRQRGVDLLIEPINEQDMPSYFLNSVDLACDVIAEMGEYAPGLQFDIYHCGKIHGDVLDRLNRTLDITSHYQIAGLPDRHEPSADTLPHGDLFESILAHNGECWIGCEYHPAGETGEGLSWLNPWR